MSSNGAVMDSLSAIRCGKSSVFHESAHPDSGVDRCHYCASVRPVAVPGREHVGCEAGEIEAALPGETPVVTAPRQRVHAQQRGIGELHEEDLFSRDVADRTGVMAQGQDVEAVQADAQLRMCRPQASAS